MALVLLPASYILLIILSNQLVIKQLSFFNMEISHNTSDIASSSLNISMAENIQENVNFFGDTSQFSGTTQLENNHSQHGQAEVALFRAIILQAIIDRVSNSKRTEDKVAKADALNWFNIKDNDFQLVCHLAGWNPQWIIQITEIAMKNPEKWRKNHGRYS